MTEPNVDPTPAPEPNVDPAPNPTPAEPNPGKWDAETTAYIKQLRNENAARRTENKEVKDNMTALQEQFTTLQSGIAQAMGIQTDLTPEQQLEEVTSRSHDLETQNAMLSIMMEKGIGKDQSDYFSFLVEKKAGELGENEEMTDEMIDGIVAEVQRVSGRQGASTSVTTDPTPNPQDNPNGPSLEEFASMSISEKSALYGKSPELYNTLMTQAAQQNLV